MEWQVVQDMEVLFHTVIQDAEVPPLTVIQGTEVHQQHQPLPTPLRT